MERVTDCPSGDPELLAAGVIRADAGSDGIVPLAWSAAVGAFALAVYLALAPGTAGMGDSSEITLALAVAGVPHPTGYPLFGLLGHGFCTALHAFGVSWWLAANAWSALGAAVAVFLLHALAARLIPADAPLTRGSRFAFALAPAWLFGFHPQWLQAATLAEVHSWHVAWVSGAGLRPTRSWMARGPGCGSTTRAC